MKGSGLIAAIMFLTSRFLAMSQIQKTAILKSRSTTSCPSWELHPDILSVVSSSQLASMAMLLKKAPGKTLSITATRFMTTMNLTFQWSCKTLMESRARSVISITKSFATWSRSSTNSQDGRKQSWRSALESSANSSNVSWTR